MLRTALLLLSALAATAVSAAAGASPLVRVDVVDRDDGQWLAQYRHRDSTWIAGRPGHRYAVRLVNTTGERVLVVLSVDGVNAITGQTADPSQAGYVLAPWQSTEIAGWRKSLDGIAQFVFTDLPDSYAARTGRPAHVGVIGIAAFRERPAHRPAPPPVTAPIARPARSGEAASAESATAERSAAPVSRQGLGTGHGRHEWSPVGQTSFVRAGPRPAQVSQIRYDAPARLVAMGVSLHRDDTVHLSEPLHPRAFPGGFVPDPD